MRVHISLNVQSLSKSQAFYVALFGQEASKQKPGYANFRLNEPPIHLALVEGKNKAGYQPSRRGGAYSSQDLMAIELPDHNAETKMAKAPARGVMLRCTGGGIAGKVHPHLGAVNAFRDGDTNR